MSTLSAALAVLIVGGVAGLVGVVVMHEGQFVWPRVDTGRRSLDLGNLREVFAGAVSALIIWTLLSPVTRQPIWPSVQVQFTFQDLGGAIVSGIGGANIIKFTFENRDLRASVDRLAELVRDLSTRMAR